MRFGLRSTVGALVVLALLPSALLAQGRAGFLNVESPQVHPVEVAKIGLNHYLLVCNTPANTVEIWETAETQPVGSRHLATVPTGLRPVSVRYNPADGRMYTANFLGDSITVVRLAEDGGGIDFVIEQTRYVGDEPADIAFGTVTVPTRFAGGDADIQPTQPDPPGGSAPGAGDSGPASGPFHSIPPVIVPPDPPGGDGDVTLDEKLDTNTVSVLYVTHHSLHGIGIRRTPSLDLIPLKHGDAGASARVDLVDRTGASPRGIKEPRAILTHDGELFVLGFKGGNTAVYDFDLFIGNAKARFRRAIDGLGSTNWNMALGPVGASLFVVGGEARNDLVEEPAVAAAETGFVKSTLYWIRDFDTNVPDVQRKDLNALVDDAGLSILDPVSPDRAISMPTAVLAFRSAGHPLKVFIAGFGSDRLGIVEPQDGVDPDLWPTRVRDISPITNPVALPRGLAVKTADPQVLNDPGDRLYVLNKGDNSVTIFDPVTETFVDEFELTSDPRPAYVRQGMQWLYSAKLTSNSGFNSCAMCHTDGRLDGMSWNLGNALAARDPFNTNLPNGIPHDQGFDGDCNDIQTFAFNDYVANGFPNKSDIITQSLQGLVNFEIERDSEFLFTNAVYHWRGDRSNLAAFNPAFVNLLGMTDISGDPKTPPAGLTDTEMDDFTEFVNSIHYPPNPQQPLDRRLSGNFGPAAAADDIAVGTGGQRGLKVATTHGLGATFGTSCTQCHQLPEGSDNRITEMLDPIPQPLETAAMRGLFQKARRLDKGPRKVGDIVIAEFGTNHKGGRASLNGFNMAFSGEFGGLGPNGGFPPEVIALNSFWREIDWGVAPLVGRSQSMTSATSADAEALAALDLMEGQAALGHAGVAVQATVAGTQRGFWYDLRGTSPTYVEEPGGASFTRAGILALLAVADDVAVWQSVPLGSERRNGTPPGVTLPIAVGPSPSNVQLLGMEPGTMYESMPLMKKNHAVFPVIPGFSFEWTNPCAVQPANLKGIRLFEYGLIQDGAAENGFGKTELSHDAPRHFVVAGDDIKPGARLILGMPDDNSPPDTGNPPSPTNPTLDIVMPLYPTNRVTQDNRPIWVTAIESEPLVFYAMMLGGPKAPNVVSHAFDVLDILPEPPLPGTFDPIDWNWYYVTVDNNDGSAVGVGGWQRLTIAP